MIGKADNMLYIVFALGLFMASVIVHIGFCRRTSKAGLQAKAYLVIGFVFLSIYAGGVLALQHAGMPNIHSFWGLPFKITAGIIFLLLVPVYLCFYVLTQLTSPSKKILLAISQRGELSHSDIVACVQKEDFITTRLKDLCASGCVTETIGRYTLSQEGKKIAVVLDVMQCVLGRDIGG